MQAAHQLCGAQLQGACERTAWEGLCRKLYQPHAILTLATALERGVGRECVSLTSVSSPANLSPPF